MSKQFRDVLADLMGDRLIELAEKIRAEIKTIEEHEPTGFGQALEMLKAGKSVARRTWNGLWWIELQRPDGKMTMPYIYVSTISGLKEPWVAAHCDMLAEDWVEVGTK